jgi:hypothetical protein
MLGPGATIVQDENTLTLTRTTQMGEIRSVYNLDGSDSKNTLTMGGNSIEQISKAKWDGNKLVIVTTSSFQGTSFESTVAMELNSSGQLVVQATQPGFGGAAPTTTTLTYKKS